MSREVLLRHQHAIAASKAPQSFRLRNAPLLLVDVAVAVRVEHEQRGLEARRDQQVLEVLVAAVVEKLVDDLLRVETKREAFRSSTIEPIVEFSQVEGRSWSETRLEHRIL